MSLRTKSFGSPGIILGLSGPTVMLLGMLMFSLNDVMGKWLVANYGVGQIILIRSVAALCILAPFIWRAGLQPIVTAEKPMLQIARVFFSTFEVFAFYYAVMYLPLADVMTYWLAAPIYVAAASPLLLGEKVGWRRWLAIGIGFVGVIIALNPSSTMFTLPALISVAGTMGFAFMMISGRQLRYTPDRTLAFFQLMGALIAGLIFAPFDWVPIASGNELVLMLLLGIIATGAHMLVNRALKIADAATVAPLQYTLLFWAVLFGWIFFDEIPSLGVVIGAIFIVASGLFIFFREQKVKNDSSSP